MQGAKGAKCRNTPRKGGSSCRRVQMSSSATQEGCKIGCNLWKMRKWKGAMYADRAEGGICREHKKGANWSM